MIAWLGTGLLGSGFVRALRRRGEPVCVWNRSEARARALESEGARGAPTPGEAVRGASRVHLTLSDDGAVDSVLERIRVALAPGALVIDHTTTSARGARDRASRAEREGYCFVHAPVFMGPVNALESSGVMLVSGAAEIVSRVTPLLAPMTGSLAPLGADPGRAAALKLVGNALIASLTAGLADAVAVAKAHGLGGGDVEELLRIFQPGASLPQRLARVLAARYGEPSWELAMARKDVRLMSDAAAEAEVPLVVLPALAAAMDAALAEGHAASDWTVFAKAILEAR